MVVIIRMIMMKLTMTVVMLQLCFGRLRRKNGKTKAKRMGKENGVTKNDKTKKKGETGDAGKLNSRNVELE